LSSLPLKLVPLILDEIEILKDDLFHFPFVRVVHVVAVRFFYLESGAIEVVFTFFVTFFAMDVDWFMTLVGIEKESPTQNE